MLVINLTETPPIPAAKFDASRQTGTFQSSGNLDHIEKRSLSHLFETLCLVTETRCWLCWRNYIHSVAARGGIETCPAGGSTPPTNNNTSIRSRRGKWSKMGHFELILKQKSGFTTFTMVSGPFKSSGYLIKKNKRGKVWGPWGPFYQFNFIQLAHVLISLI